MANKFVVMGLPRSGTTHFCDKLTENLDVFMSQISLYEPFNPRGLPVTSALLGNMFDQYDVITRLTRYGTEQQGASYVGFKTFPFQMQDWNAIERHGSSVIIILRKNIWKVVGSMLTGAARGDYRTTSKTDKFTFDPSDPMIRTNFLTTWHNITAAYWHCENTFKNRYKHVETIYFEDMIQNGVYSKVNEYFNYDYDFSSPDYDDSHHPSIYYKNWGEFVVTAKEWMDKSKPHYASLPDYVMEHIENEA